MAFRDRDVDPAERSAKGLARSALSRAVQLFRHGAGRPRTAEIVVAGEVDETLLATAAALRRLGARIARYDTDEGAVEARRVSADPHARLTVHASGAGPGRTTVRVASDGDDAAAVLRRFRAELTGGGPR